jgi:hemolysin activation/secretion protein
VIAREEKKHPPLRHGSFMGIAYRVAQWAICVLAAVLPAHVQSSSGPENPEFATPALLAQAGPAASTPTAPAANIVPAEPVAPPKFEIQRYRLEGNTLLRRETIDRVLAPYTGKGKDFGDVQRALEALQGAYQQAGYGGVEVRLPEQELERGEVRFVVIETKIARITVEGNEHFTRENILRSVPSLRVGETPNSREISESIRLANENPSKQSTVLLRGSEREGEVDATIRVADIDPRRWSVSLDNTGNENTGRARLGIAFQDSNMFERDHVMTAQFITSPSKLEEVLVFGVGYKIPFYGSGNSVDIVGGYSNVDSGTVQDLFLVAGQGSIYGFRYNQALPKWGDLEQKLIYGLDYRAYQNQVNTDGSTGQTTLVPDITVHPVSLTYTANLRLTGHDLSGYFNLAQNIPGGSDGQVEDFNGPQGARPGVGAANYRLYRAGLNYVKLLPADWQLRTNFAGQFTRDALVAPEQFGIGGADSIRGFNERYASNDKGYRTTFELYTPDYGKAWGLPDGRLRFLVFYDTGSLRRNFTTDNELDQASLDATGLGLRLSYKTYFTMRLDVAHVLHDGTNYNSPDTRRNIQKFHLSLAWVY